MGAMFNAIADWDNLWRAYRLAAHGKRRRASAAEFEHQVADRLIALQGELRTKAYRPGAYCHFFIHEPKRRKISAAPRRAVPRPRRASCAVQPHRAHLRGALYCAQLCQPRRERHAPRGEPAAGVGTAVSICAARRLRPAFPVARSRDTARQACMPHPRRRGAVAGRFHPRQWRGRAGGRVLSRVLPRRRPARRLATSRLAHW